MARVSRHHIWLKNSPNFLDKRSMATMSYTLQILALQPQAWRRELICALDRSGQHQDNPTSH